MTGSPLISVVVPVYGVEPYLRECVDSLLAQTHQNIEIILVDDGSTDGSGALCDRYARDNPQAHVIHKPNGGLSDARNAGLGRATGDWVMFLDGDDWIETAAVEHMLRAGERVAADVVVAGFFVDVENEDGARTSTSRTPQPAVWQEGETPHVTMDTLNLIGYAWNKLYRREHLGDTNIEFPVGISLVEDILFNGPVLGRATRIAFLDEALVHYVQRRRVTLGTKPQAHFGDLMTRASAATRELLADWGVAEPQLSELIDATESARVQWAVRSSLLAGGPVRARLNTTRKLLGDQAVRSVLSRDLVNASGPRSRLIKTQLRGQALPSLLVLRVRSVLQ
jgi:hypothetical protein